MAAFLAQIFSGVFLMILAVAGMYVADRVEFRGLLSAVAYVVAFLIGFIGLSLAGSANQPPRLIQRTCKDCRKAINGDEQAGATRADS